MRRLVISLLAVVLAASLGAGWALDRLFTQALRTPEAGEAPATDPFTAWRALGRELADLQADGQASGQASGTGRDASVLAVSGGTRRVSAQSLALDDAALLDALHGPYGLALQNGSGVTVYYATPGGDGTLLALTYPVRTANDAPRLLFTLAFYLVVLGVVAVWLLPLLGRLARLGEAARAFGTGELQARVATRGRSELRPLEAAFNAMAARIERLIDDNRLLGRGVAHDLKTPLARLRFGIDSLQELDGPGAAGAVEGPAAPVRRDHLERLQRDLDSMERQLDILLDYARFEVRGAEAPRAIIDLRELVMKRLALFGPGTTFAPPPQAVTVHGNPRQLATLIDNLIGNARRHGDGLASVFLQVMPQEGCELRVEDGGPGVALQDRLRILHPFERGASGGGPGGESSQASRHGPGPGPGPGPGHGLGLALVARIAECHGATVSIGVSTALGGAAFAVRFPTAAASVAGR